MQSSQLVIIQTRWCSLTQSSNSLWLLVIRKRFLSLNIVSGRYMYSISGLTMKLCYNTGIFFMDEQNTSPCEQTLQGCFRLRSYQLPSDLVVRSFIKYFIKLFQLQIYFFTYFHNFCQLHVPRTSVAQNTKYMYIVHCIYTVSVIRVSNYLYFNYYNTGGFDQCEVNGNRLSQKIIRQGAVCRRCFDRIWPFIETTLIIMKGIHLGGSNPENP